MNLRKAGWLALISVVVLLSVLPVPDFWITQLNYVGIASLAVLGLVLLTGIGGLTSFGQAAFVGIGAYTSAYLTLNAGLSPWLTLWIGLGLTAMCAWMVGWITLRMSGHYLPLATLAWGLSLYYTMGNLQALGKYDGLLDVPGLSLFGWEIGQERAFFLMTWALVLLAALCMLHLLDSRVGRAIRSLKSGSIMAESMGIDTLRFKIGIFIISALLASVSGWLYAHFQRSVNPSPFGVNIGIEYLFMAVLGGAGYVWGAITGTLVTKLMADQLQVLLPALIGTSGSYETIVFGVLLVLTLKYAPDGIWAFVDRKLPKFARAVDWRDAAVLPHRTMPAPGEAVLQAIDLRKEFGGLVAVNDISFSVQAGQIVGLIGPNGAGKSTTFNLITGVLGLTSGRVYFRGEDISGQPSREIAKRGISRTFQHVRMIPDMTVLENVALGAHLRGTRGALSATLRLDRHEEQSLLREAEQQLKRVGMGDYLFELAGNLAMGQQRLLEIARALCNDPALLLLDEPAAGLRHQEKLALADVLRQLKGEGLSILLVEHDMDLVMQVTDRIVVMEFGTHLIEGTPDEIQASPAVQAAYLGTEH
ncbi:MAG: branched-chain amino acid ABC transporter ATP-binding protein/permease [Gammaproteobacteria bacterium]|jgi:branched-chain amino acid transport system permease protein|nr:branched-chain amino acid ABC transporter ATP-binding protein/permease [Gammaproteobacteria bacterium]MBU0788850.1 branched-chain amino acid ABC transporter ATP-binding protein/permease [Gammaproteobacteria bacterium]MBU0817198.1 branched-chain amino acid ABC transporter ATP-binding protein/permease [Gammaproteobacteria bacterium]MBU1787294.1 branched-chain amino acid ABC transporter ATP-binding protein/permease [Gammaproteobacteria bacterium]